MPLLKREADITPGLFELDAALHPWRVAHVRSRQEKVLARHCHDRGIPFYLPLTANEVVTELRSAAGGRRSAVGGPQTADDEPQSAAATIVSHEHQILHPASPTADRRPPSAVPADRRPPTAVVEPTAPIRNPQSAIRNHKRIRLSYNPLFTGYVFLRPDPAQRVDALRSNVIVSLLEVADQDLLAGELGQIHALQQAGALLVPFPWLGTGDPVRIRHGAFAGWEGTIVKEKGEDRLVVSVTMLMRSVLVELGRENVAPGSAPSGRTFRCSA